MALYRVEMMGYTSYCNYMGGSNEYCVEKVDIEAENEKEAIRIAKEQNPKMFVNENYVRTVAELEEAFARRKAEWEAFLKAEDERKARNRAKRKAREVAP